VRTRSIALLAGVAATLTLSSSCSSGSTDGTTYDVEAGDDSCTVSDTSPQAGAATFKVKNTGSQVTEVYVYGKDGDSFDKIVGEKENIGPGTSQSFLVNLSSGDYEVACKPGMKGDGIRTRITVSGGGGDASSETGSAYDKELEFEVTADGAVKAPSGLQASVGDKIEFKLANEAADEYYLEVKDASGAQVGKAPAAGGSEGEFIAELPKVGTYTVLVFPEDEESQAQSFRLVVG
jgi:iron uptake system component EfeO